MCGLRNGGYKIRGRQEITWTEVVQKRLSDPNNQTRCCGL